MLPARHRAVINPCTYRAGQFRAGPGVTYSARNRPVRAHPGEAGHLPAGHHLPGGAPP